MKQDHCSESSVSSIFRGTNQIFLFNENKLKPPTLLSRSQKDIFSAQLLNGILHLFLEHNLGFTHAGVLSYFTSQFL